MDRTDEWNKKVELIKDKYKDRIVKIMEDIREAVSEKDLPTTGVDFMDADDYWWSFLVFRDGPAEVPGNKDLEVSFKICESPEYDGSEDGIAFRIDLVEFGGLIVGGFCPYNYTDRCWVSIDDEAAIEERFKLMEESEPEEYAQLIVQHFERRRYDRKNETTD